MGYHFLRGSIFFLNKLHDFHSSDCSAIVMASVFLAHDPILLPLVSRCNNVGMLHKEHSSSQSSLWDKSQNSFLKISSLKVSTTIFTILSLFSSLIDNSKEFVTDRTLFTLDILLEQFRTQRVWYGGYRNFCKLTWKSTFINYRFLYHTFILLLLKQLFYNFPSQLKCIQSCSAIGKKSHL